MNNLAGFLLARIAEDKTRALAASTVTVGYTEIQSAPLAPRRESEAARAPLPHVIAEHVAAWNPARVRAECDATRRMVEPMRYEIDTGLVLDVDPPLPPHKVLRLLALPYAGHPDDREEWRP